MSKFSYVSVSVGILWSCFFISAPIVYAGQGDFQTVKRYENKTYGFRLQPPSKKKIAVIAWKEKGSFVIKTNGIVPEMVNVMYLHALSKEEYEHIKTLLFKKNMGGQRGFDYLGENNSYYFGTESIQDSGGFPKWITAGAGAKKTFGFSTFTLAQNKKQGKAVAWKTYSNTTYKFSLQYPKAWALEENFGESIDGTVITLKSPEVIKLLKEEKIAPGYSDNVRISFWPTINNIYASGGTWDGKRNYTGLADYFTDKNAFKEKIGKDRVVAGKVAHDVSINGMGAMYGVMIENDGIYELAFPSTAEKEYLGSAEKKIISTFKFLK